MGRVSLYTRVREDLEAEGLWDSTSTIIDKHLSPDAGSKFKGVSYREGKPYIRCALSGIWFPATTDYFTESTHGIRVTHRLKLMPYSKAAKNLLDIHLDKVEQLRELIRVYPADYDYRDQLDRLRYPDFKELE